MQFVVSLAQPVLVFLRFLYELRTRAERIDGHTSKSLLGWPSNKMKDSFRPPGTVVPGGLIFYFFNFFCVTICGATSPRWLGRSPWNFYIWLEVCALKHCVHRPLIIH